MLFMWYTYLKVQGKKPRKEKRRKNWFTALHPDNHNTINHPQLALITLKAKTSESNCFLNNVFTGVRTDLIM